MNGLFISHPPFTFELFSGFWLKAFLSLTLSMVVVASLVGYAQDYDYYCYFVEIGKTSFAGSYWYYISAWAYGCFYAPSNGNL
jgi:hypothetical protein